MPGFNGTGPQGQGPLTGRGRGYCISDKKRPNFLGRFGLGNGNFARRCNGSGYGRRNRFWAAGRPEDIELDSAERIAALEEQNKSLQESLSEIKAELKKINAK